MTEETSQSLRGWLKEVAPMNMSDMSVTEETSQVVEGLVEGGGAPEHVGHVGTEETSQSLRGRLKEEALPEHVGHVGDSRDSGPACQWPCRSCWWPRQRRYSCWSRIWPHWSIEASSGTGR